jgi:hypothetical protein
MLPLNWRTKVSQQIRAPIIGCWDASVTSARFILIIGVVQERNWRVETPLPFIQSEVGGKRNQIWLGTTGRFGTRCVCPSAPPLEPSIFTHRFKQLLQQQFKSRPDPKHLFCSPLLATICCCCSPRSEIPASPRLNRPPPVSTSTLRATKEAVSLRPAARSDLDSPISPLCPLFRRCLPRLSSEGSQTPETGGQQK